jgi:ribonucleoside-diphosphate reductase alpha chain
MTKESRMRVPVQPQTFQRYERHATEVTIGGERLRLTAGQRPDGTLGQVTIGCGGCERGAAGLLDGYATALSLGLECGVPLTDLLRPGLGLRFTPDGDTNDPEIPRTYSAVDYCCRRLAIDWLPYPERAALGVFTLTERDRQPDRQDSASAPDPVGRSACRHRRPRERADTLAS